MLQLTLGLEMFRKPGVHLTNVIDQRQMPVVWQEPGRHPADMLSQPFAMTEGHEPVLSAVQQQDRNGDAGQLKPPRNDERAAVIPPPLAAGR